MGSGWFLMRPHRKIESLLSFLERATLRRRASMPLEMKPGMEVPIPCRPCGQAFMRVALAPGVRTLSCARCGGLTVVTISEEAGRWLVRTAVEEKGAVAASR